MVDILQQIQSGQTPPSSNGISEDSGQTAAVNPNTVSQGVQTTPSDSTNNTVGDVPTRANAIGAQTGTGSGLSSTVINNGPAATLNNGGGVTSSSGGGSGGHSNIRPNPLHAYTNHTYKFSLYAVPTSISNRIYDGVVPGGEQALLSGAQFMLSDGGHGADTTPRTYFTNDIAIDNVEIENVIGINQRTRGTDIYNLKFDIIEPYTTNFFTNLYNVCQAVNPNANWNNSFFLMKIEFLGYDDLGVPKKIPNTTKYIPFTFVNIGMKITSGGAVYSCQAMPLSSIGATVLDNQIPGHVELRGATVQDIFKANGNSLSSKDLVTALENNEELKKNIQRNGTVEYPTKYEFLFDPAIGNASILDLTKNFKEAGIPMPDGSDDNAKKQGIAGKIQVDFSTNTFHAQAGTKITDFINAVVNNSIYMTYQYDSSGKMPPNKPINIIKVTPVVKFGRWDSKTNYYERTVKYIVSTAVKKGYISEGFGQQQVQPSDIIKEYDYIYTGNSRDVLDVNLSYQMMFFNLKNGVPSNYTKTSDNTVPKDEPESNGKTDNKTFFNWSTLNTSGLAHRQHTGQTTVSKAAIAVQDLMSSLMDNDQSIANLDFTIIGDPDWIVQDMALYTPIQSGPSTDLYWGGNYGINFSSPRYFNFYFGTPQTDYNDTTGLFGTNVKYNEFSGIFEAVSVKSMFNGGKFTQKITNVRVWNQGAPTGPAMRSDTAGSQPAISKGSANNTVTAPTASTPPTAMTPAATGTAAEDSAASRR